MRVLVACEYSGRVREAFKAKGHYSLSCDLLPSELPGNHYEGNVFDIINDGWDLMIAHPPCTYLSFAGNRWWNLPGRQELREAAYKFFLQLYNCDIPKVCVENPTGYINKVFRKPDQIIHPYYFGDPEMKRTCLWLKGLPLLSVKDNLERPLPIAINKSTGKKHYRTAMLNSWKDRSRTYSGIAKAFADQWG